METLGTKRAPNKRAELARRLRTFYTVLLEDGAKKAESIVSHAEETFSAQSTSAPSEPNRPSA
jgi:hypothetical protein